MSAAAASVALDATGGDHGPSVVVAAALTAVREHGLRVIVAGPGLDDPALEIPDDLEGLTVVAADSTISMDAEGALAIREQRDASVRVAARLVAEGRAGALISAGHTGATLAAALLELGRLPGVRRPVLAVRLPDDLGGAVLVDVGAAPDATAAGLLATARMGAAYVRVVRGGVPDGAAAPRVGLVNVGTEPGKGSALARDGYEALGVLTGFVGNVEPGDVLDGGVDVAVTDGFTGNVMLKTIEALVPRSSRGAGRDDRGHAGAACLLGVGGTVCVAHGAADADELVAALRTAASLGAELPRALTAALADDGKVRGSSS